MEGEESERGGAGGGPVNPCDSPMSGQRAKWYRAHMRQWGDQEVWSQTDQDLYVLSTTSQCGNLEQVTYSLFEL